MHTARLFLPYGDVACDKAKGLILLFLWSMLIGTDNGPVHGDAAYVDSCRDILEIIIP